MAPVRFQPFQENQALNPVHAVGNGEEAIQYLAGEGPFADRVAHPFPALFLLDLKMPRIDGLEVLKRVRAHPLTRLLPVIVLTSSAEERDIINAYQLGSNSYIRKPVDFNQFAESVKQLGLYWLVLNQAPPAVK